MWYWSLSNELHGLNLSGEACRELEACFGAHFTEVILVIVCSLRQMKRLLWSGQEKDVGDVRGECANDR